MAREEFRDWPRFDQTWCDFAKDCVCRVCVVYEFYAFYAFHAVIEPVSYGSMEGLKVQVPSPAFYNLQIIQRVTAPHFSVCVSCVAAVYSLRIF
jgi:hypothetical protein